MSLFYFLSLFQQFCASFSETVTYPDTHSTVHRIKQVPVQKKTFKILASHISNLNDVLVLHFRYLYIDIFLDFNTKLECH
jgi:hypothetical protein